MIHYIKYKKFFFEYMKKVRNRSRYSRDFLMSFLDL